MKDALISELSFCLSGVMVQFDTLMKEAIERGVPIHPSFPDERGVAVRMGGLLAGSESTDNHRNPSTAPGWR